MKSGGPLKRTALSQGAKSLERGSTFASRGSGLKRTPFANHAVGPKRIPDASMATSTEEPVRPLPPVRFKATVPAYTQDCLRCLDPRPAQTWHHWVGQAQIRAHTRRLGLPEGEERGLLRRLLNDLRNCSPYCWTHHDAGEHSATDLFRQDEIPASAWEFAAELGPWAVARLDRIGRENPPDPAVLARIGCVVPLAQMSKAERRAWLEANPVPRWPGQDPLPTGS